MSGTDVGYAATRPSCLRAYRIPKISLSSSGSVAFLAQPVQTYLVSNASVPRSVRSKQGPATTRNMESPCREGAFHEMPDRSARTGHGKRAMGQRNRRYHDCSTQNTPKIKTETRPFRKFTPKSSARNLDSGTKRTETSGPRL
eukprot:336624-Rhodomonas_salina.1